MKEQTRNLIRAFLHGITGAGLFRKLDPPHAPSADSGSIEYAELPTPSFPSSRIFWTAFLDGFTMRGLWKRLTVPGTPTQVFDENSDETDLADGDEEI